MSKGKVGSPITVKGLGTVGKKGGLHKSLGIPQGQKIPKSEVAAAAKRPGKVGKQARLAETMEGWKK